MSLDHYLEEKQTRAYQDIKDREERDQTGRSKLRDFAVQLRDPGQSSAGPASRTTPTFKIGDAAGFPYVPEGPGRPGVGNMSPAAFVEFKQALKEAADKPDIASRDVATQRAAHVVAKDWAQQHGHTDVRRELLHEARAQATFAAREIGHHLGLDPVSSSAIGYSLERAMEKEGFKTFVNKAIDGVGSYAASSPAAAAATGMRASMETQLNKSMTYLAEHGVTRDALKEAVSKHSGKLLVLAELYAHPEVFQRAAQVIAHSDKATDAIMAVATDAELRKAVGTLTLAAGENLVMVNRAAGSTAVVAGAILAGESSAEVGRHAFRAALSVAGGAAGGIAAGAVSAGFGTIGGGIAGSMAGAALADKVLEVYDKHFNPERAQNQERIVAKDELKQSAAVVAASAERSGHKELGERLQGMEREYSMGRSNKG